MLEDIQEEFKQHCEKALEALHMDLARVRTGRANVAILDRVRVDYYGTQTPLNQTATLTVTDPRLIVVKPWDKSQIQNIEKAIQQADLGLTPQCDGEIIRLPIPKLSEERRQELVKLVHRRGEEARVSIRNARRDTNEMLKELEQEKEITEDQLFQARTHIQKETNSYIKKVDETLAAKEKELMEV